MSCTLRRSSKNFKLSENAFHRYDAARPVAGSFTVDVRLLFFFSYSLWHVEYLSCTVSGSAHKKPRVWLRQEARQPRPHFILSAFVCTSPDPSDDPVGLLRRRLSGPFILVSLLIASAD